MPPLDEGRFARPPFASFVLPPDMSRLSDLRQLVSRTLEDFHPPQEFIEQLVAAVDEAVANTLEHGKGKCGDRIEVYAFREGREIRVMVRDQTKEFDPTRVPPPDVDTLIEKGADGGLGVHLMRRFTDEIVYERVGEWNELTLIKRLPE